MNKFNNIISYFKKDKKKVIILAVAILGALMIVFSFGSSEQRDASVTLDEYKEALESEISELCKSIDGVGKCRVKITFSEGESYQYRSSTLISSSPPKVLGVAVICEGGDNIAVKEALVSCMTSLFDIGSNRVCVLKMEK